MGTEDDLILNFVFLKMGLIPQQFTLHKFSYRSIGAPRHSQAFVYALAEIDLIKQMKGFRSSEVS